MDSELDRLRDSDLWAIARQNLIAKQNDELHTLLDVQNAGELTVEQEKQLDALRTEYGRVLLRKARALALLAERGYSPLV